MQIPRNPVGELAPGISFTLFHSSTHFCTDYMEHTRNESTHLTITIAGVVSPGHQQPSAVGNVADIVNS